MTYDRPRFALPGLSPAIQLLMLANVVVFVANMLLVGRLSEPMRGGGGLWFAFSWPGLWDGYGLGCLRLLSYQFTHSFTDPMHLLMNMLVLWCFGPMVEQRLGAAGTVRFYLWGGALGAMVHVVITALQGMAGVPVVGASGACYGFLVYAAFQAPRASVILFIMQVPLWALATLFVGKGLYDTYVEFATGFAGGVSNGAHLGGALLGAVAFKLGWFTGQRDTGAMGRGPLAALRARWRAARADREARARADDEAQLESILAKIKLHGLSSLTDIERRFLKHASEQAKSRR